MTIGVGGVMLPEGTGISGIVTLSIGVTGVSGITV
jgi:hypothetical protein